MYCYTKRLKVIFVFIVGIIFLIGCNHSDKYGEAVVGPANPELNNTFVYIEDSPYKDVLKECVGIEDVDKSCSLDKLPLLMQESETPTKEMIMQRVVVSHKWMGDRFAEMLDVLDDDIKKLLGATTAIVIDDDIKPAFYWSWTGAIYLDPRYLWLTPEEAQTIVVKEDYRASYGNEISFYDFRRYIKDDNYVIYYFPLDANITRGIDDIKYGLARLLYHELSHANDFATKDIIDNADKSQSIYDILYNSSDKRVSSILYRDNPLTSSFLKDLGQVLYHGEEPTDEEKDITAKEVGYMFDDDSAVDMYGYSTQYEDLAMMFEVAMMKYHYNLDYDIGFIPKPSSDENLTYRDYIVAWGKRNRIADESVANRALFVVKSILPNETDWDDFFINKIGTSQMLKEGENWYDSRILNSSSKMIEKDKNIEINSIDFRIPEL